MTKKLFEDWNSTKEELLKGLDPAKTSALNTILDNQGTLVKISYDEYIQKKKQDEDRLAAEDAALTDEDRVFNELRYPPAKPIDDTYSKVIMPIIRRVIPAQIAAEILGCKTPSQQVDGVES